MTVASGSFYQEPVPLQTFVLEVVARAGKDPATIFAVLDLADALQMYTQPKPAIGFERIVILFTDWTFLHVDLDVTRSPRM